MAEKATKIANSTLKTRPGSATAICAPASDPSRMPGTSSRTTGHNTAPRLWCARTDDSEEKQMVASDVATAIFTV